eukprot:765723-Hanusia_phi.AAC.2
MERMRESWAWRGRRRRAKEVDVLVMEAGAIVQKRMMVRQDRENEKERVGKKHSDRRPRPGRWGEGGNRWNNCTDCTLGTGSAGFDREMVSHRTHFARLAAAVCGAIGAAAGAMAAIYTTRKKDEESGVAEKARALSESLKQTSQKCMEIADEDEEAYAALQASWKDSSMTAEQKAQVEATALDVPVRLLKLCHAEAVKVHEFIPSCNPNIVSDAKVTSG